MAGKSLNYYLTKIARITGWLLLIMVTLYILTGFALCGKFGFSKVIDVQTALEIHQIFDWPLIGIFLVHSVITIYFAFRRWGWIKKKTRA